MSSTHVSMSVDYDQLRAAKAHWQIYQGEPLISVRMVNLSIQGDAVGPLAVTPENLAAQLERLAGEIREAHDEAAQHLAVESGDRDRCDHCDYSLDPPMDETSVGVLKIDEAVEADQARRHAS